MSKWNEYENIKLPKIVNLKINTEDLDEDTLNALKCLYTRERAALPFELPRIMTWPAKERANGERAAIVLKSGFLNLMGNSISKEPRRAGATKKKSSTRKQRKLQESDGFPSSGEDSKPRFSL